MIPAAATRFDPLERRREDTTALPPSAAGNPGFEKGDPLRPVDDTLDERELLREYYYPNLNTNYEPRDWDEPPWGHKEG